jgi:LysM repeat protein
MSTMVAAHDFRLPGNASSRTSEVRLTRRGRMTLLVLLVGLAFALLTVVGGQSAATGEAGEPVMTRTVVVAEGDTLWGIAAEVAEPGEVRETMHYIEELNALSSSSLMVGQEIAVPVE